MTEDGERELRAESQRITDWLKAVNNDAWMAISEKLEEMRQVHVAALIKNEDAEARGRIKQIDDLLSIPDGLRSRFNEIAEILSRNNAAGGNPIL